MIDLHLVRLIERHEKELAHGLLARLAASKSASDLMRLDHNELEKRVLQIYRDLMSWLMNRSESELESVYKELGRRRCDQGIRFDHMLWAFALTKEQLWDFVTEEEFPEPDVGFFGLIELLRLVEQFFDRAIYFMSVGYREVLWAEPVAGLGYPA